MSFQTIPEFAYFSEGNDVKILAPIYQYGIFRTNEVLKRTNSPLNSTAIGSVNVMRDPRSWQDFVGDWHIRPFAFDEDSVYIVCPLCGRIHSHGFSTTIGEHGKAVHCSCSFGADCTYYVSITPEDHSVISIRSQEDCESEVIIWLNDTIELDNYPELRCDACNHVMATENEALHCTNCGSHEISRYHDKMKVVCEYLDDTGIYYHSV